MPYNEDNSFPGEDVVFKGSNRCSTEQDIGKEEWHIVIGRTRLLGANLSSHLRAKPHISPVTIVQCIGKSMGKVEQTFMDSSILYSGKALNIL